MGAGDAIGAAVAQRFARGGYKVCIARRDAAKSQKVVDDLKAEGRDVRSHPFERGDLVLEAEIRTFGQRGMGEEAETAEAIIEAHQHHAVARQLGAVEARHGGRAWRWRS